MLTPVTRYSPKQLPGEAPIMPSITQSNYSLHGKSEAAREAGVSGGVVDGLVDEGTLAVEAMPPPLAPPAPDPSFGAAGFFPAAVHGRGCDAGARRQWLFHVALLDGVTGSGKTEVYFEAIAEIIRRNKQTLILMLEIALDRTVPRSSRRSASACVRSSGIPN